MHPETVALRKVVYDQYGGCCQDPSCAESDYDKLVLDHTYGAGNQERRLFQHRGAARYQRIIRDGYPEHLQLLCYNCNQAKQLRYTQEQDVGEGARMPPGPGKKQLHQTVEEDTYQYFEQLAKTIGCSVGKAIDLVAKEHASSIRLLQEIRAAVTERQQARTTEVSDGSPDYEYLDSTQWPTAHSPTPTTPVVTHRKLGWLWR